MNKLFKRTLNIAFICILVFAMNIVAFAQGTTTISVSKSSGSIGDSITVSVTATESGTITVKYTSSMLSLSSCSVSGYTSEGNSVSFSGKSGDLVFSAVADGTASIIVSSSSCSGSSTTLTIGGSSASSTAEATTQTEPVEEPEVEVTEETESTEVTEVSADPVTTTATSGSVVGTLNGSGGFDINGVSYVVSERYTEAEMPSGFSKTTVKIGSSTYSEPTNGIITLLYLKPADNTSGSGVFYLYDEAAGTVSNFVLLGDADKYVLVKDTTEAPGSGFSQTVINVDGNDITAYTVDGAEFFYVYGTNQDQVEGWFVYDQTYGTVSRVDSSVFATGADTSDDTVEETEIDNSANSVYIEKLALYRKIIMGLIVLCVILIFVTINGIIKNRGEDDDDFDGDVFAKSPVKTSRRLPRSIVFDNPDDEDDEDDEYDEEDEYDDEEDDYSTSEGSYEERRDASLNMMDLNDL